MHVKRFRPDMSDTEMSTAGVDFVDFFNDRLKVQLREQGARHDLVDAVLYLGSIEASIVSIVRRVEALGKFLDTEDGKNLLAGYKRAINIIRIEEKKDRRNYNQVVRRILIPARGRKGARDVRSRRPERAGTRSPERTTKPPCAPWRSFARTSIEFFDKVTVNVEDKQLRENRLKLLNEIREATRTVADFSRIEG